MDLRAKLLTIFAVEHAEHVERIRAVLAAVEQGASLPAADLDEAFRRAHSLKGAARAVDLLPLEQLAHQLESLLSSVRAGAVGMNPAVVRSILGALDSSEDWLAATSTGQVPPDLTAATRELELAAATGSGGGQPSIAAGAESPSAPRAEPTPPLPVPESAPAIAPEGPASLSRASFQGDTVRISVESLDRLLRSAGQLLTESQRQELVSRELTRLVRRTEDLDAACVRARLTSGGLLRSGTSESELAPLARHLEWLERELRALSAEVRGTRLHQQRSAFALRQLGDQLEEEARRARLVSAGDVWDGFRKMMRDLARDGGTEVEFQLVGAEVQADRRVLQSLKDPVMHLLRNSLSHGIEPPEVRALAGKPRTGRVTLRLEIQGSRLCVCVEDDGRGLDLARVREGAVRRGLVSAEAASGLSPAALARLVFHPGFSTAGAVTDLSGRGMGLSVVQDAVARLQGDAEIMRPEGAGIRFVLTVPMSVTTHRLLLVSCQGETFALPSGGVERLLRIRSSDLQTVGGRSVIRWDEMPLPVVTLAGVLDLGDKSVQLEADYLSAVIVRAGTTRVGLLVDEYQTQVDAVIRDLGPQFAGLECVSGGIILADGSVVVALSVAGLVQASQQSGAVPLIRQETSAPVSGPPTILVVDDSVTTRTLEKSILEVHGYRVRVAVDGLEALHVLQLESADLVIVDVEMPRMDGFGFLEAVKRDDALRHIPVIIVSSLEKREDKARGLELGADAYIVKGKFDQQELLDTIRQII